MPPSVGGGFEFQQTVFNEVLKRTNNNQEAKDIVYIPIAQRAEERKNWCIDPNQSILLDSLDDHKLPLLKKVFTRVKNKFFSYKYNRPQNLDPGKSIKAKNIDIIWSLSPYTLTANIPFIITVWDLQHRLQPFFPEVSALGSWSWDSREKHYAEVARKAFLCVVGTNRGASELRQFYGIDKNRTLVNPFPSPPVLIISKDKQTTALQYYSLTKLEYIIYPAQFWSHKNHLTALLAIKILVENGLRLKLVLTGSDQGTLKAIMICIKALDLESLVIVTGFIDRQILAALYMNSAALIFPSFFGPDNIPPLEAMSYKVPTIVSNVPGAREQYGNASLYFDPEDPGQLASLITSVLDNPSIRESLVSAGAALIKSLTPNAYVDQIENALIRRKISLYCSSLIKSY